MSPQAKALIQSTESITAAQLPDPAGAVHKLYMQRHRIHWTPYNEGVVRRFWAAGTSLVGVVEQDLITRYKSRGIDDIRVILPNTELDTIAHHQLHQFNMQPAENMVHNQVDAARGSYEKLSEQLSTLVGADEYKYLRKYAGIMYFNITIFDDDAFLSPYNTTGVGNSNLTLHFNSRTAPEGYRLIEDEFIRMWDTKPSLGLLPRKGGSCSMIFTNSSDCLLLYLRDQKPDIPHPGKWDLFGGYIKEDESPEDCITRELLEEIEYNLLHPTLFRVFNMPDRLEFTYWCTVDFDISRMPLHEGQKLRWFSEDEILTLPANQVAFGFKPIAQLFLKERRSGGSQSLGLPDLPAADQ